MGSGLWKDFARVARLPHEISVFRPFYPNAPGGTSHRHLLDALAVGTFDELRRVCERRHALAKDASPLFWTMGPNQVGKAALSGWREILVPGLRDTAVDVAIWPFDGTLPSLLAGRHVVVVETYPGEMYHHIGVAWPLLPGESKSGKGSQIARRRNALALHTWAQGNRVHLQPALVAAIDDGFGSQANDEYQFDAIIGLFGMLNVLLGNRSHVTPDNDMIQCVEGWIFGRAVSIA